MPSLSRAHGHTATGRLLRPHHASVSTQPETQSSTQFLFCSGPSPIHTGLNSHRVPGVLQVLPCDFIPFQTGHVNAPLSRRRRRSPREMIRSRSRHLITGTFFPAVLFKIALIRPFILSVKSAWGLLEVSGEIPFRFLTHVRLLLCESVRLRFPFSPYLKAVAGFRNRFSRPAVMVLMVPVFSPKTH